MGTITPPQLQQVYSGRFRGREAGRERIWSVLAGQFFQRWVAADAVVLDLGAGYGEFLRHIRAGRKLGVDANPQAAQFWSNDVEPFHFDVTVAWPLPRGSVDCVFTSNFFEHLADKTALERCVEQVFTVLKPGGILLAMGPNIRRTHGAYWDFFDHFVPLTERSLSELLVLKGFQINVCRASFLPPTMSFAPPSMVAGVFPGLLQIYLRCSFLWPLFGKQFLVIASRPQAARRSSIISSSAA